MFVSKKKYNELKEKYDKLIELNNENCKRCRHKEQTFESRIKTRDSKIDTLESTISILESQHMTIPEGRRLTEEELSTLIAVDLIKILYKEAEEAPTFSVSDKEQNVFYGIDDLEKGLFNG